MTDQLLKETQKKFDAITEWYRKELAMMRAGRATPALVEDVMAEAYQTRMPLKQLAAITLLDARTISIEPWDQAMLPAIERAISQAQSLGLSPVSKGKSVLVMIPPLNEERKMLLVKTISQKLEEARIRVRRDREDAWNAVQEAEKAGKIREDDKFRAKDTLQEMVDDTNKIFEEAARQKEDEIRQT